MAKKSLDIEGPRGKAPRSLFGPIAQTVAREFPGRVQGDSVEDSVILSKPKKNETPWRSWHVVSQRHSADGNSYQKDEPIPEIEAQRQGQLDPGAEERTVAHVAEEAVVAERTTRERLTAEGAERLRISHEKAKFAVPFSERCNKCRGTGKAAKMKNHKPNCGCVGCRPCGRCDGTGLVRDQEE